MSDIQSDYKEFLKALEQIKPEEDPPEEDDSRALLLKVVRQAEIDFINLEDASSPVRQGHYETAKAFLFEDDYYIQWGDRELSCEDILDLVSIDIQFYREKVLKLKEKRKK